MDQISDPPTFIPARVPTGEQIKALIAAHAAEASGCEATYYLDKLGSIEAVQPAHDAYGTAWRLQSYHGSAEDGELIEQAAARTRQSFPFMNVD